MNGASGQHATEMSEARPGVKPEGQSGLPPLLPTRRVQQRVYTRTTVTGLQSARYVRTEWVCRNGCAANSKPTSAQPWQSIIYAMTGFHTKTAYNGATALELSRSVHN